MTYVSTVRNLRTKMRDDFVWVEKYRPHSVEDCILPESMKAPFKEYVKQKQFPNLLLSGGPGVGKTTIAKAMCDEIGCDYMVINGSLTRGINMIRDDVATYASSVSFRGGRKVIIVDEADNLTPDAQKGLRAAIEEFSKNCAFIFTCNFKSKIMEPLHSRFAIIDFKLQAADKAIMATEFFKRVCAILKTENVEYEKPVVIELITKYFPDYRRILNELQHYASLGKISANALAQAVTVGEVMKTLKDKDFVAMRKWVAKNPDLDAEYIYRAVYNSLYEYLKPETIPLAVITIADYQYKAAFVADQELNLVACLTTLLVECEFK
jgi:DNA polymerase III delta prime subunit